MVYEDYFEWSGSIFRLKIPLYIIIFLGFIIAFIVEHITEEQILAIASFGIFTVGGFIFVLIIVTIRKMRRF